jgi:hypothetical protein
MEEYVGFLTALPIKDGEAYCVNFLPSALFPKHSIHTFFDRVEVGSKPDVLSSNLWSYGKQVMRAVEKGSIRICIEAKAINNFCTRGYVHEASPKFEVGFAVRVQALHNLKRMATANGVMLIHGPIPYVFRLRPPSGVLLDVAHNVAEQRIQGLWIEDDNVYKAFEEEFIRLEKSAPLSGRGEALQSELDKAISHLTIGDPYQWSWV